MVEYSIRIIAIPLSVRSIATWQYLLKASSNSNVSTMVN